VYNVLAGYFRRLGEAVVEVVVVPDRQRWLTNVPVTVVVRCSDNRRATVDDSSPGDQVQQHSILASIADDNRLDQLLHTFDRRLLHGYFHSPLASGANDNKLEQLLHGYSH